MDLITVKDVSQVKISGVELSWEKHDGNIQSVTITDMEGNTVTIKRPDSYSSGIVALIPKPPKMEEKFLLTGTYVGVEIKKVFNNKREAESTMASFIGGELEIKRVIVAVNDDGEIISDEAPF